MARPPRCLVDDLSEARIVLPEGARRHLQRVLRMRPGETVELVDGSGGLARGVLTGDDAVQVESRDVPQPPGLAAISLAVAMPRLPRLEWLIEKSCELGVAHLRLLRTRHGERDIGERRLQRLQRIADEALLQCRRLHRMVVHAPADLQQLLAGAKGDALWLACTPDAKPSAPPPRDGRPLLLLVGPEGGFSTEETERALRAGASSVSVGHNVLRVETAALAMATLAAC